MVGQGHSGERRRHRDSPSAAECRAGRGLRRLARPRAILLAAVLLPVTIAAIGVEAVGERTVVLTGLARTADQSRTSSSGRVLGSTVPVTPSAAPVPASSSTPTIRRAVPPPPARTAAAPHGLKAAAQDLHDLAYADASPAQHLDLYLPDRTGAAVPLVISIHGGAFKEGDKADATSAVEALRARGYAVASINYRLSGEARFPAGARDVKAAVRWLRAHAAAYGLHPGQFAAWGESAGGYLAVLLAATGDQRTTFDDATLGNAGRSSAVQAVVDLFGPSDFLTMDAQAVTPGGCPGPPQVHDAPDSPESLWLGAPVQSVPALARAAGPISYLTKARILPPFMIAHGDQDCLVPHGQSLELVAALKKRAAKVDFTLVPGAGHGGAAFDALQAPEIDFLDRTFGRA